MLALPSPSTVAVNDGVPWSTATVLWLQRSRTVIADALVSPSRRFLKHALSQVTFFGEAALLTNPKAKSPFESFRPHTFVHGAADAERHRGDWPAGPAWLLIWPEAESVKF